MPRPWGSGGGPSRWRRAQSAPACPGGCGPVRGAPRGSPARRLSGSDLRGRRRRVHRALASALSRNASPTSQAHPQPRQLHIITVPSGGRGGGGLVAIFRFYAKLRTMGMRLPEAGFVGPSSAALTGAFAGGVAVCVLQRRGSGLWRPSRWGGGGGIAPSRHNVGVLLPRRSLVS